jgi:hypothetical protein
MTLNLIAVARSVVQSPLSGIEFQEKFKETQEVARINIYGSSQLKYKLKVESF